MNSPDSCTGNGIALGGGVEQQYATAKQPSPSAAVEFSKLIGRLKVTPRTGWVRRGVPRYESVADHSWRVAALSLLLFNSDGFDVAKCMQLAVVHDLAECVVGDIAPGDNVAKSEKEQREMKAMDFIASFLPMATGYDTSKRRLMDLFHEYEKRTSEEARAVKDLDLLDMILQADEYETRFGTDLNEFFDGTPPSRFRHIRLRDIAEEIHREREQRKNGSVNMDDSDQSLCTNDAAFLEEYSKASTVSKKEIHQIVLALRQWESDTSTLGT